MDRGDLVDRIDRLYPAEQISSVSGGDLISAMVFFGGMTVNTVVQLHTNRLEFYAGKKGAVVYLNHCGRIHLLRFDCNYKTAYQMLIRFRG